MKITRTADVVNIERHAPSKFLMDAQERLLNEVSEKELKSSFQTEMVGMIDTLFQYYLKEKAVQMACEQHPVLNKSIWETALPETVKMALEQNLIFFVKNIVEYDKEDLALLTSLSVAEIDLIAKYLENNMIHIG